MSIVTALAHRDWLRVLQRSFHREAGDALKRFPGETHHT